MPFQTYPIQKQALSVDYLRDNAHLRARTDVVSAMLRVRDHALRTLHRYFEVCLLIYGWLAEHSLQFDRPEAFVTRIPQF